MKAIYKVSNKLSFEINAEGQKGLFEELADIQGIFSEEPCGKCQGTELKYVVRENSDNKFYEVRCTKCGAKLKFGQHKGNQTTLFPKRKNEANEWMVNSGWTKWNKDTQQEE